MQRSGQTLVDVPTFRPTCVAQSERGDVNIGGFDELRQAPARLLAGKYECELPDGVRSAGVAGISATGGALVSCGTPSRSRYYYWDPHGRFTRLFPLDGHRIMAAMSIAFDRRAGSDLIVGGSGLSSDYRDWEPVSWRSGDWQPKTLPRLGALVGGVAMATNSMLTVGAGVDSTGHRFPVIWLTGFSGSAVQYPADVPAWLIRLDALSGAIRCTDRGRSRFTYSAAFLVPGKDDSSLVLREHYLDTPDELMQFDANRPCGIARLETDLNVVFVNFLDQHGTHHIPCLCRGSEDHGFGRTKPLCELVHLPAGERVRAIADVLSDGRVVAEVGLGESQECRTVIFAPELAALSLPAQ